MKCLQFLKKENVVPHDVGRCCNIFKLFHWCRKGILLAAATNGK